MELGTIIALLIAGAGFLWTLYRDKSDDTEELLKRMNVVESNYNLLENRISSIEDEQDEMKEALKTMNDQIHKMDVKIERILAILESKK